LNCSYMSGKLCARTACKREAQNPSSIVTAVWATGSEPLLGVGLPWTGGKEDEFTGCPFLKRRSK
jgi:hypothetical protein